ncbi:hypothetical protein BDR26DRAFT_904354 [Obelidium mucronatum]|nr:hypothetical protein BDR26DRAFT_904354 [Obelidium mucronatum]
MSAPAYTLNLVGAPACIPIDYMMHFAWTATAGNNDWIGTYAPGECVPTTATCTVQLSAWSYISTTSSSTSGVLTMKAPSAVGNFTAYYLLKNGYTYAAQSTSFYVQSTAACAATTSSTITFAKTSTTNVPTTSTTLSTTTTSISEIPRYSVSVDSSKCIQAGTAITATWTTTQGNAASNDWIGVFPVGTCSNTTCPNTSVYCEFSPKLDFSGQIRSKIENTHVGMEVEDVPRLLSAQLDHRSISRMMLSMFCPPYLKQNNPSLRKLRYTNQYLELSQQG